MLNENGIYIAQTKKCIDAFNILKSSLTTNQIESLLDFDEAIAEKESVIINVLSKQYACVSKCVLSQ